MIYDITVTGADGKAQTHKVELGRNGTCRIDGEEVRFDSSLQERDVLSLILGGQSYEVRRDGNNGNFSLWLNGAAFQADVRDPRSLRGQRDRATGTEGAKKIIAP